MTHYKLSMLTDAELLGKEIVESGNILSQKLNKDGSGGKTSIYGTAEEKVTLKKIAGGSPEASILVAYKGGKAWCKCG